MIKMPCIVQELLINAKKTGQSPHSAVVWQDVLLGGKNAPVIDPCCDSRIVLSSSNGFYSRVTK